MKDKEKYVIDISWIEPNLVDKYGTKYLQLKMFDGFETLLIIKPDMKTLKTSYKFGNLDPKIVETIIPIAKPRKWVPLKTVNSDKVMCEYVATHEEGMLLRNNSNYIIFEDGTIGCCVIRNLTPIPPPNPALEKIAEFKSRSNNYTTTVEVDLDDLNELEALIKEQTHG